MSPPVPPTSTHFPDAVRRFFATLALHVLGNLAAILGVILLYGLLGGAIAACGWLPIPTNSKADPPSWMWNVCSVVAGIAIVVGLAGGLVEGVRWVKARCFTRPKLRLVLYPVAVPFGMSLGVLLASLCGALFLLGCVLCLGFAYGLFVAAPFGAGQDIGLRFFGLRGGTFGEGFQIGILGASALGMFLGVPFGILGMAGDLWHYISSSMAKDAIGRVLLRMLYGALAGVVIGALTGWLAYRYAWSNAWADGNPGLWAAVGAVVLGLLSLFAQVPRDAPEQVFVLPGGALLGVTAFAVAIAFSASATVWTHYLGAVFLGALVGVIVAWVCWFVFGATVGWFLPQGPTFEEVFPDEGALNSPATPLVPRRHWLLAPVALIVGFFAWTELPYRFPREVKTPTSTSRDHGLKVALARDASAVVCGDARGKVRVIDLESGDEVASWSADDGRRIDSVVIAPDDRSCLVASSKPTGGPVSVSWREIRTGNELQRFDPKTAKQGGTLLFAADGRTAWIGAGSIDREGTFLNLETGAMTENIPMNNPPAGERLPLRKVGENTLEVQDHGSSITVLKAGTGDTVVRLEMSPHGTRTVSLTPDGKRLAALLSNCTVRTWDVGSGKELRRIELDTEPGHTDDIERLAVSADGRFALTGSKDTTIRVWDLRRGKELVRWREQPWATDSVGFSPDGRHACTAAGGRVCLWEVETGRELQAFSGRAAVWLDANTVLSISETRGTWEWREPQTGKVTRTMPGRTDFRPLLACTPDGQFALTAHSDHCLRLWDLVAGKELRSFPGHVADITSLGISAGGHRVAATHADGAAWLWDTATGEKTDISRGGFIRHVTFSRDGKRFATASGKTRDVPKGEWYVRVWDATTGREVRRYHEDDQTPTAVALSADGSRLLWVGDKRLLEHVKMPR